eukprot:5467667-Amphidinium_carterae.1
MGICSCNFTGLGVWGIDPVLNRGGMVLHGNCLLNDLFCGEMRQLQMPWNWKLQQMRRHEMQPGNMPPKCKLLQTS